MDDGSFDLASFKTQKCQQDNPQCEFLNQKYANLQESLKTIACFQYHNFYDRRRNFEQYQYNSYKCIDLQDRCDHDDDCTSCRNLVEYYYHPENFRKNPCQKDDCFLSSCHFSHDIVADASQKTLSPIAINTNNIDISSESYNMNSNNIDTSHESPIESQRENFLSSQFNNHFIMNKSDKELLFQDVDDKYLITSTSKSSDDNIQSQRFQIQQQGDVVKLAQTTDKPFFSQTNFQNSQKEIAIVTRYEPIKSLLNKDFRQFLLFEDNKVTPDDIALTIFQILIGIMNSEHCDGTVYVGVNDEGKIIGQRLGPNERAVILNRIKELGEQTTPQIKTSLQIKSQSYRVIDPNTNDFKNLLLLEYQISNASNLVFLFQNQLYLYQNQLKQIESMSEIIWMEGQQSYDQLQIAQLEKLKNKCLKTVQIIEGEILRRQNTS